MTGMTGDDDPNDVLLADFEGEDNRYWENIIVFNDITNNDEGFNIINLFYY